MRTTISFFTLLCCLPVFSQNIILDPDFGTDGIATVENTSEINKSILNPDGTIISAGFTINTNTGGYYATITKHRADGTLETSFGTGGITYTPVGNSDLVLDLEIQPDGKILLAGTTYQGQSSGGQDLFTAFVIRYHSNGLIDYGFASNGIFRETHYTDSQYTSIILQSDGSLLLIGNADNLTRLTRLTSGGVRDINYGINGVKTISDLTNYFFINSGGIRLNDGYLLCYGMNATTISNSSVTCAKIDSLGNFVSSFGQNGKASFNLDAGQNVSEMLSKARELPDGTIILAGSASDKIILKILADGIPDSTFGTNGVLHHTLPFNDMLVLQNGKILIGGSVIISTNNYGMSVSRFNSDGTIDPGFNGTGTFEADLSTRSDLLKSMILVDQDHLLATGVGRLLSFSPNFALAKIDMSHTLHLDENKAGDISVYPNPFSSELSITSEKQSVTSIQLIDASGRIVNHFQVNDPNTKLFLDHLAPGIYQAVFLLDQNERISKKLMKQSN
ncbi:T9SS type A sorting domain-containing protein [Fluviicola sp.]|uniref:T9SS type A sorting domain-containing protein n=1 Tax=Fluviicola sp. TaxID=1917219 RepID=UPI0031E3D401